MKVKVVTCWDDGVINDIRLTNLFRKYNAKATFNLNPGLMGDSRLEACWKPSGKPTGPYTWSHNGFQAGRLSKNDIAEVYQGFELASHCWKHENAGTIPDSEWIKCACDARAFLEDIAQKPCLGFAWPCGVTTPETIALLREKGFKYARGVNSTEDVTACTNAFDLTPSCHFMHHSFWDKFEKAKQTGVFYFWGHSYEMYQYDPLWEQLEGKVKALSEDPNVEWANVIDIVPLLKNAQG